MSKISDEVLVEYERFVEYPEGTELGTAGRMARELRDYRKAVREYLNAVDALNAFFKDNSKISTSTWAARGTTLSNMQAKAEATLRALQERI